MPGLTPEDRTIRLAIEGRLTADGIAAAIREAEADARAPLLALLRMVEWAAEGGHWEESACPVCHGREPLNDRDRAIPEFYGHRPDCALAAAIKEPPCPP